MWRIVKSKFFIVMTILAAALWVAPALAFTTGVFTGTGTFDGGLPVSASARFLTSTDTVEVEVWNNQANPTSAIQCLSGLGFVLNTGQTIGSPLSFFSATVRTIDKNGSFTYADAVKSHWQLDNNFNAGSFGHGLKLNDLKDGQPINTLIGPANPANPTQYTAANPSITGKSHAPEWFGTAAEPVEFFLHVNGVTNLTTVTFVQFSFGTTPGCNIDVQTPAVPIPPSALLLGSGLLGLVVLRWRKVKVNSEMLKEQDDSTRTSFIRCLLRNNKHRYITKGGQVNN